jgi:DNA repair exonuclease SbcCD ATPase subunit
MNPFGIDLAEQDSPQFPKLRDGNSRRELFRSPPDADHKKPEGRVERVSYFRSRADIIPKFSQRTEPAQTEIRQSIRTSISEERLTPTKDVIDSADYSSQLSKAKFQNHALQAEIEELRIQILEVEQVQAEKYVLLKKVKQLTEELEVERNSRQETSLQKERALNTMIEDNLKLIETLQTELNRRELHGKTLERSLQERSEDNKLLVQENRTLRGNLAAAQEAATSTLAEGNLKCSRAENRASKAEEELADLMRRYSDKQIKLASLKAKHEETVEELGELQSNQQSVLINVQQELAMQRRTNSQLTQRLSEAASKQEDMIELRQNLQAQSDVILSLETDLASQRDDNRKLRRDVDFYREKENKYEALAGLHRTLEGNSHIIKDMSTRLNQTSSKVMQFKQDVNRLAHSSDSDDSINGEGLSQLVKESRVKLGLHKGTVAKRRPRRRKL